MPACCPPARLLCLLLCCSVADLRLTYVTHSGLLFYSCSQDSQPCSSGSLQDCGCRDIQLSTLHWSPAQSVPALQRRHLTVWFTSPSSAMRLLNNSEVRHLTLIHCGPPAVLASPAQEGYFAVQRLERLTVVNVPERLVHPCADANRAKNMNTNPDGRFPFNSNRHFRDRDTNMDLGRDTARDSPSAPPAQIQDLFLGRELGAAHHEQARLGVIHSSVLDWGSKVKAYTVQSHIDSDGELPFPELRLEKLPETPLIYVSFVYS